MQTITDFSEQKAGHPFSKLLSQMIDKADRPTTRPPIREDTNLSNVMDRYCHWLLTEIDSPIISDTTPPNDLMRTVSRMYEERLHNINPHVNTWERVTKLASDTLASPKKPPEFFRDRVATFAYLHLENMYFPNDPIVQSNGYDRDNALGDMSQYAVAYRVYPIEQAMGKTDTGERQKTWESLYNKLSYMIALHHFDKDYQTENNYPATSHVKENEYEL